MVPIQREITEKLYEDYQNGKLTLEEIKLEVTSASERLGYGIYGGSVIENEGKYFFKARRGSSCD